MAIEGQRVSPVRIVVTALGALLATGVAAGIWGGLLMANLATTPALPWSAPLTWILLALAWAYAGGAGPPVRTSVSRRAALRGTAIARPTFTLALAAGGCALVALIGLWIVLFQSGAMRGNSAPAFAQYPPATVIAVILTAALMGGITEEAAFRGYLQGLLERRFSPLVAIVATALVLAPAHAATQGFALPTFVFYLLVDAMLGATAFLTGSIVPGIVIHAIGLAAFFGWIWPDDATRVIGQAAFAEPWFWGHIAQIAVFGGTSLVLYQQLAATRRTRQETAGNATLRPDGVS